MSNVPVFILAGGLGTRLSEYTDLKPKPMVEIGGIPILLHIMRSYYAHGFNDFVICAGYRSWEIKNYFLSYPFRQNHLMIDQRQEQNPKVSIYGLDQEQEKWRVRVIDTGENCMTGGRVARALDFLTETEGKQEPFENFALTYGDGVSDVNLSKELEFHLSHQKVGTVLGVRPIARFGELEMDGNKRVSHFSEKPHSKQGLINGGFFFFKRKFREYLDDSSDYVLEQTPLARLANDGELMAYEHPSFWHPMDTLRDKNFLEELWVEGKAPWKSGRNAQ